MHGEPGEQVVIVSPHLDDAILSLGSWMTAETESGAILKVVTVLAGDPLGNQPASNWDLRCGFDNQAEATEARRREDARACEMVGAEPVWLPFTNGVYGLPDDEAVWNALRPHLAWADTVLVPGCPLRHPDHRWLASLLFDSMPQALNVGFYLEQPYAARHRVDEFSFPDIGADLPGTLLPSVVSYGRDHAAIKRKAARSYNSQLKPLGRRFPFVITRLLRYESARGGETIAWLVRSGDEDQPVDHSSTPGATASASFTRSRSGEEK